jgi:hypothetical protein
MILQKLSDAASFVSGAVSWLGDLSADIFWGLVTSYPTITVMGVAAAASFAISHTPAIVERFFPVIMPYTRAAGIVCLVSSAWLMFAFGYRVSDGREEIERVKNELAWVQWNLHLKEESEKTAFDLMSKAKEQAATAEGKLSEYESRFGKNPSDPPPGVIEWLRSLQQHPQRRAAASQPQRGLVARVRTTGAERQ